MGQCCSRVQTVDGAKEKEVKPTKGGALSFNDVHNPVRRTPSGRHTVPINQRPPFVKCYTLGTKLGEGSYSIVYLAKQILPPGQHMDALNDIAEPSTIPAAKGDAKDAAAAPEAAGPAECAGAFPPPPDAGRSARKRRDSTYDEGHKFAVKVVDKRKLCRADLKALASEVRILKGIQCENVVHLYECFDEAPLCYLVTELCSGGELFDRIVKKKTYTEACAREAVHQVLNGVAFLHSHNVVHRDLKPENVRAARTRRARERARIVGRVCLPRARASRRCCTPTSRKIRSS